MGSEDQALTVHSNKIRRDFHHPKGKHFHQKDNPRISKKDLSKFRCYTCDERGHFASDCPRNKNGSHKKKVNNTCFGCSDEMKDTPDGCQDCFLEWCSRRGSVCGSATHFETHDRETHVCKLKKSWYSLK